MKNTQQIQPLVKELMKTLLEDCPTLLDETDRKTLMDREFCKRSLGLSINNHPLLRRAERGPKVGVYNRYWTKTYGAFHVCSQWWKVDHVANAGSLLNFVNDLIDRKAEHPSVQELHQHRKAFEKYLRSSGRPIPPPTQARRPEIPSPLSHRSVVPAPANHTRNQILYGPPGTGKTYSTVSHALAIIDGVEPNAEVTEADRRRFRSLRFERLAGSASAEGGVAMVTFHQNYAYEDFVEGIRPRLAGPDDRGGAAEAGASPSSELGYELRPGIFRRICEAAERERQTAEDEAREPERFVLIIDEINRGNIAKIFGELITLMEDSRRLGAKDETTVTLPYSGDEFGVPDNLYIIGTMNTADRSIQQLDTALRRRFTFVEMMPDPDHHLIPDNVAGVNCRKMLRAMNERIALLMDREHQIGHTYLLEVESIEDLADRFRNRIFPLLQEYFYDDWRRIDAVLGGNAFVRKANAGDGYSKQLIEKLDLVDEERVIHERLPDDDPAWNTVEEYQRIYEPRSD